MMVPLAFAVLAAASPEPPRDRWLGSDKVKHFLVSAFVQSVVFSATRSVNVARAPSHAVAAAVTLGAGVWKERLDRRAGRPFSARDLAWGAGGGLAAAALLHRTR